MMETTTEVRERPILKVCEACGKEYTPKNKARAHTQRTCSYTCRESLKARPDQFWAKVFKSRNCWEWQGTKTSHGYGVVRRGGKSIGAHRIAYQLTHGDIPTGLEVCHTCDNPSCVRPDHLFLGTHGDNMRDMCRKVRHNKPKGEQSGRARLTELDVRAIRIEYDGGFTSYQSLGKKYGVAKTTIEAIIKRHSWRHL